MQIHPVRSKRDHKAFIQFPYRHYARDPLWVPPLRSETRKLFDPEKNPFLEHCEWQLFLLRESGEGGVEGRENGRENGGDKGGGKPRGRVLGRIAAFIDTIAMEAWGERIGFFGYFECVDDAGASRLLFDAARDWLLGRDCIAMRGPWSFVTQEWGMVVEGFAPSPVVMAPHNYPYYQGLMEEYGLEKAKDMLCWEISRADGYQLPERILRATDAVRERYGIRVRSIDMKNFDREIGTILEISNASYDDNWGYSPATDAEADDMAREMKRVLQPGGVLFAEDREGRVIGYIIALPDINHLLKGLNGRLFPFGFLKLLRGIPRLNRYRLFGLSVRPEYQKKAVDSLLYRALGESLPSPELWLEINYVLEDNWPMVNAVEKLEAKQSRRYRVYEMPLPI